MDLHVTEISFMQFLYYRVIEIQDAVS